MKIAVFTTGRQDWGILRSTVKLLSSTPGFQITVVAGGMACSSRYGDISSLIKAEGIRKLKRLEWKTGTDDGICAETSRAMMMSHDAMSELRPDAVMILGDRFETMAIAVAAVILKIPIIHLHGGEETLGAMDNQFRHAITKLGNIHFASCETHANRIIQMGEDPKSVFNVGAPGLDNIWRKDLPHHEEVLKSLGIERPEGCPLFLTTYHPPTLIGDAETEIEAIINALERHECVCVLTMPNNEPGNGVIRRKIASFAKRSPRRRAAVSALGEKKYWSLLKAATAVIGNSSSGIIEAPAIPVPVLNIGSRQKGRLASSCVMNIENPSADDISSAIDSIVRGEFPPRLPASQMSLYGDGRSARRIVGVLKGLDLRKFKIKKFHDLSINAKTQAGCREMETNKHKRRKCRGIS